MARNIGVNFNGQRIVHPSAHAKIDASALNSVGSSTDKILAIVGQADGGVPNEVYTVSSSAEATEIFKGGDIVKACELAFNPSGDSYGAGTIIAMRAVSGCSQATLTAGGLTISAVDYGLIGNNILVSLTVGDEVNLTVIDALNGTTEYFNDLGKIIRVVAVADYTDAYIKIADGTLTINDGANDVMSIVLAGNDITKVLEVINGTGVIKAYLNSPNYKTFDSANLDAVEKAVGGDNLTGIAGDILFQTEDSTLINVEAVGEEISAFTATALAGGADGELAITDTVLANLNYEGVYLIVPLTDDVAMQNIVHNYVIEQSQDERSLMLGFYGGGLTETVDEVIERALGFSSARAIVAYPPILKAITTGEDPETLPSYFTACLIAGRVAGVETGEPITLDTVSVNGLATNLSKTNINKLLEAGVTTLEFVRNSGTKGYRIAQGITTYQSNSNPNYREISMCTVSDELVGEIVERLETNFVGGKGTTSTLALIKNDIQSFLDQKVREEVIVEYDAESVTVQLDGDVVYVTFACVPVGAINYILVTTSYSQASLLA